MLGWCDSGFVVWLEDGLEEGKNVRRASSMLSFGFESFRGEEWQDEGLVCELEVPGVLKAYPLVAVGGGLGKESVYAFPFALFEVIVVVGEFVEHGRKGSGEGVK